MTFTKEKPKKLFRFILLLFPIFIGTMGTITLVVLVTWLIPPRRPSIPTSCHHSYCYCHLYPLPHLPLHPRLLLKKDERYPEDQEGI